MKRNMIAIVGIFAAIGLLSMMNPRRSPQAQVQVEDVTEDEPIQAKPKYHPSEPDEFPGLTAEDELPTGLAADEELPEVNGKRPTVQGLRDFGLERARKLIANIPEIQPWKSELKLDEQVHVRPAEYREHLWKVYGRIDKANDLGKTCLFMWIAFVSFDGDVVENPYRMVVLEFK